MINSLQSTWLSAPPLRTTWFSYSTQPSEKLNTVFKSYATTLPQPPAALTPLSWWRNNDIRLNRANNKDQHHKPGSHQPPSEPPFYATPSPTVNTARRYANYRHSSRITITLPIVRTHRLFSVSSIKHGGQQCSSTLIFSQDKLRSLLLLLNLLTAQLNWSHCTPTSKLYKKFHS